MVASPCTGVCEIDARGWCRGCGRSLDEIARWTQLPEAEQAEVVRRAQLRRQQAA